MIPTLDLFSGIGGFSYALKQVCKTVAYCEIDQDCKQVISNLISKKRLENAKIYSDITKIDKNDLRFLKPEMLTAGFPCQDISVSNPNGKGLNGNRSGLFFEIMRLVDELPSISYLLLENSPMIKNRGLFVVKKELKKRGFKLCWGIFEARMVGALHKRRRWIGFAYKKDKSNLGGIDIKKYDWEKNIDLVVKRDENTKRNIKRCKMLGNSIVPQMIQYAWNVLIKQGEGQVYPDGLYNNDKEIVMTDGKIVIKKERWATPTYTRWEQYRKLTQRGAQLLGNQVYYNKNFADTSVPVNMRDKFYTLNPNFVEHLMGYPKGWTIY